MCLRSESDCGRAAFIALATIACGPFGVNAAGPANQPVEYCGEPAATTALHAHLAPEAASAGEKAGASWDFFTNYGNYMPRIHCVVDEQGQSDWPWIAAMLALTVGVVVAYLRIFVYWIKCYREERPEDRNNKLMELAWIFLFCAICGYVMQMLMFAWPAYRLLVVMLVVLNLFSWKFIATLNDFKVSFSARRLQRELAESMRTRTAELERMVDERTREAEEARQGAVQANLAKSRFVSNMSHEIRTPMNAILGFTDLLARPDTDEYARAEYLATIRRNGEHLLTIINDVLDLSRIEAGKMAIEPAPTDFRTLLEDVRGLLAVRAADRGIEFTCRVDGDVPQTVTIDPTRLRQVLINLAGNAIKFTERGSVSVVASYDRAAERLRVRVVDTGIGISPEQGHTLFQPFVQAEPGTARRFGGSGLGLSISRRLCELMGGDLTFTSQVGLGSTFVCDVHAPPCVATKTGAGSLAAVAGRLSGRVLVVDDGLDNRRLMQVILSRAGATVELAADGDAALKAVVAAVERNAPFDLVIMDIQMPVMDGIEATRAIRSRGIRVPILAATAQCLKGEIERCLAAGCNDAVSKPVAAADLIDRCARAMQPHRAATGAHAA